MSLILLVIGAALLVTWQKLMFADEAPRDNANYGFELDSVQGLRAEMIREKADLKKLKKTFVSTITGRIFPYWYGTKWDFNGTTQVPNEGSIACGYFVTTTLEHMGVPINRVKMAQCASEEMIRSLTSKKNIHHLSGMPLKDFEKKLMAYGKGLYIVGLDNHTGYLLLAEEGNYFIHSSGWFPFKVVKEKLSESSILGRSTYRVVGKISDDELFLKRWLSGSR